LIEQILASHPDVLGAGELPFVGELARNLGEPGPPASGYPGNFLRIGPEEFARQGEAYVERLSRLAPRAARIVELVVEGDRAAMLYDCELPGPVGTLQIASFFRVENGKIRTYSTQFDATELRKLLARKSGG